MVAFTFVAIGVFIAAFVDQLTKSPPVTTPPNIDASLLVLMGISQGAYVGKKLVTTSTTILYGVSPSQGDPELAVGLNGSSFGTSQDGSQLTLDGGVVAESDITSWSDKSIGFKVPARDVARNKDWDVAQDVSVRVIVNGQPSNSQTFTVNPPWLDSGSVPSAAAKGSELRIAGKNLGEATGRLTINGSTLRSAPRWSGTEITFTVPDLDPATNQDWQAGQKVLVEAVVNGHTSNQVSVEVAPAGESDAKTGESAGHPGASAG
jgi:hypothetical protein